MIKLFKFVLVLFFTSIATVGFAQKGAGVFKSGTQLMVISGDAIIEFGTTMGYVGSFEYGFANKGSISVQLEHGSGAIQNSYSATNFFVGNVLVEGRAYFKEATRGFYVSTGAGLTFGEFHELRVAPTYTSSNPVSVNYRHLQQSGGVVVGRLGYQRTIKSNFTVDISPWLSRIIIPFNSNNDANDFSNIRGGLSIQLGYKF